MSVLLSALVQHYDMLRDHLRRRFNDRDLAADVMQDLCVRVMEGKPDVGADLHTPVYLLKHMSNCLAIDHHRANAARGARIVSSEMPPDMPAPDACPEGQAMSRQTGEALLAAVHALPERCREAFILVKLYDLPQAEAADQLGISRGMVARHVARATQALRPIIEHSGNG